MDANSPLRTDFFRYRGQSMWPGLQEGDLLEVQPVSFTELRVGDCVTYHTKDDGTLITHRISAIRDTSVHTRGDASSWPDDPTVEEKQLVGRVIGRYRLGSLNRVQGGRKGQLAGVFYHYAGRLDPQRNSRGGRAACLLRGGLQWLANGFYRRGTVRQFGDVSKKSSRYWLVGQRPWASFNHTRGCWLVPWPQSLLIDPARLPGHSQT